MFRALLASVVVLLASAALAQDLKYEKYALDNGLTVILHEDHSLPVVAVNLWYRVGAKEEPPGRSGFAHLFEHLMFMGTTRVPGGQFDQIMEGGGGSNNASTSQDRTNYYSNGPSALLPTLLWLDADRMSDIGHAHDLDKLNKQRDVVRNEIRQQVENSPYGKSEEYMFRLMYPKGHPYHEAVYGTHEDLEAASVENVRDFFATFYVPNNCSLVVAGDFKSAEIKPLIKQLFGSIPRGGEVIHRELKDWPVPTLGKVVRATMLDKVELPRVTFVYHSPVQFGPGDAEMDLAGALLSQGKSSRLFKRLVLDDKLATDVSAGQNSATLGSLFIVSVTAAPGANLDAIEKAVDQEIARLAAEGPTDKELQQRQETNEMSLVSSLDSLARKADKLNEYEYFFGEPNSFQRDLDRYRKVTPAAVKDWTNKTLTPDSRAIIRVLPEDAGDEKTPRDLRPTDFSIAGFSLQKPQAFTLANGVKVLVWPRPGIPLVAVSVLVRPTGDKGEKTVLVDNSKAGLAALTAEMLDEGAGGRDTLQFADALQTIGASFGASADYESFQCGVTVLKRNFDKAVDLLADAVRRPRMTESDFERVHRLHMDDIEQSLSEAQPVAVHASARALLGDKNAYAYPVDGLVETVRGLTLSDVKQLHAALFSPKFTTILVSGDVTADEARSQMERAFGDWQAAGAKHPAPPSTTFDIPKADALRVYVVDRPGAVQTVIRFVMPGVNLSDVNRPILETLNTLFGGSFTSRLNQNLREQHGYTYGASSHYQMLGQGGTFSAAASVRADVTGASLVEFLNEIARIRSGNVSESEAAKAKQTMRTDTIQSLQGVHGPIREALPLLASGLHYEQISSDLETIAGLNPAAINRLATQAIPLEQGVLILVGDKSLILEQIKAAHIPDPIELTPEGALAPATTKAEGGKGSAKSE